MSEASEDRDHAPRAGAGAGAVWRWLPVVLSVLAVAEFLRESASIVPQTDDAYISYRYARNLVEGHGLVYNTGEVVEGITNLFWTLLVAGGLALGFEANAIGHALGVASGVGVLGVTSAWAAQGASGRSRAVAGVAPWLVLSSVCFAYWSTSGMETAFFTLLVTSALAAASAGRLGWATAAAFLATVTRPDGGLVAAAIYGWHLLANGREERLRVFFWPAVYAALLLAVTAWRMAYYGSPVPNTFFAKVGGVPPGRGWHYASGFYSGGIWLLTVPVVAAVARDPRWRAAALYAAVSSAYVVGVGGDAFPYARFFVPLLPTLAVLAVRGADGLWDRQPIVGALAWAGVLGFAVMNYFGRYTWELAVCLLLPALLWLGLELLTRPRRAWLPALAAAGAAALLVSAAIPPPEFFVGGLPGRRTRSAALERNHNDNARYERMARNRALVLHQRGERDLLVAVGAIGAFGYYNRVPILDLFGLVDPVIARSEADKVGYLIPPGHNRSNAGYVLSHEPDYILIPEKGSQRIPAPSTLEIWRHPDFESSYQWDQPMVGYRRKPDA